MLRPDVPLMNSNINKANRDVLLNRAREAQASRIWIAMDRASFFDRGDHLRRLEENLRFFEHILIDKSMSLKRRHMRLRYIHIQHES